MSRYEDNQYARVAEDDPERCQAMTSQGQCRIKALEDSQYCPLHGGIKTEESKTKESLRNYRLTRAQARLNQLLDSSQIKSLREEIGILRIMVEEKFNACKTENDLIVNSMTIADLIMKVNTLVVSCNKIEGTLGQLLDRQQIINFSRSLVHILTKHISDEDLINAITDDIIKITPNLKE